MSEIILKNGTAERILELARQRGYTDPEQYLLDLVEADAEQHTDSEPGNEAIRSSFKRAFKDALEGKVMTKEELWRRLAEDE